jgi:c-di-GMP-related signal transduction protein
MADRFIARQPIFDSKLRIYAYELLFRSGPENFFRPGALRTDDVIANSTMPDIHLVRMLAFISVDGGRCARHRAASRIKLY